MIILRGKLVLAGLLMLFCTSLNAQEPREDPDVDISLQVYGELFERDEPLKLELKSDFKTIRKSRTKDVYLPADMTCHVNESLQVTHPVRLKARGIYRREHCSMPPLWLNIRYSGIETEELTRIRRMKLVNVCRSREHYSDYLLREYLVYKIFNLVTPYSFRVRLIDLKMVNTGKDDQETQDWAFLIEPDEMMARRLQAEEIPSDELSMRIMNQEAMDLLAMFQYMIGNPDYSVTGRQNLKIFDLQTPGIRDYIPVPYDFDFTGIVNAVYATPNETHGISSVKERVFRGPCRDRQSYERAIGALNAVRDEIEATIWAFDYLSEEERFDMIGYIESFFATAENERFIDREISARCN